MADCGDTMDDEALARVIQEEENAEFCSQDYHMAHQLQEASASELQQSDQVVAVQQQKQEEWRWQEVQQEDTKLAKSLFNQEMVAKLQDEVCDEEIAKHLQEEEEEKLHSPRGDVRLDVTESPENSEQEDGQLEADAKYAAEVSDREIAYQMQLQLDKELAERLADDMAKREAGERHSDRDSKEQPNSANFQQTWDPHQSPNPSNQDGVQSSWSGAQSYRGGGGRGTPSRGRGATRPRERQTESRNPQNHADAADCPDPDDYEANWALSERLGEVKDRSLKQVERNKLPVARYSGEASSDVEEYQTCEVCLVEFEQGQELLILPCLHKYHKDCIHTWFDNHSTCPICNIDVKEELKKSRH